MLNVEVERVKMLKMLMGLIVGLVAVSILGTARPSQALLINGDFETGDLTGWSKFLVPSGTPVTGSGVEAFDTNGDGSSSAAAVFQAGTNGGNAAITQSAAIEAGSYRLSADLAVLTFSANDGGTFELLFDGVVVDSWVLGRVGSYSTIRGALDASLLDVTAGTHEVMIRVTRGYLWAASTPKQYVDNVALEPVPDPSVASMISLGLMILSGLARRRRRASASTWNVGVAR